MSQQQFFSHIGLFSLGKAGLKMSASGVLNQQGFVFGPCFVMQYFVFFLVMQSSRCGRESWLLYFYVLWMSCGCYRSLPLPYGAVVGL